MVPVIFSLDLRDGKPLLTGSLRAETGSEDVGVIARAAIQAGVRGVLILLDVARVGRGSGVDLRLIASLRRSTA